MTAYRITQRTPLFKAGNIMSDRLGIVEVDTEIDGAEVSGGFVRTRIDAVSVDEGFVSRLAAEPQPTLPQPIPADRVGAFIALVTRMARDCETDRDYLLAVAYAGTTNLTKLGGEGDARIGPFQLTADEWKDAITVGPARARGFVADDRYRWSSQSEVAARLASDAARRFRDAVGRAPVFSELYFMQLYGDGALELLRGDRSARCRDLVAGPQAAGSYAAELATSDGTLGQALDELQGRLLRAYLEVRGEIDKQPPEIRFFRIDEGEPPWLTVARAEMQRGVAETPENKNSDDIKVYLTATGLADLSNNTPWCGAFLAYCLKTCGDKAVADSVKVPDAAGAGWWAGWGQPAGAPFTAGTVVVLKAGDGSAGHVGLIVGAAGDEISVLGGNQGGGGGPDRVSIVPFPAEQILATRFLAPTVAPTVAGIDGAALATAGVAASPGDETFVARAPGIMRDLMRDLPGLTAVQAGGILGNIGHECLGFRELHQLGMPEGKGGHGWCQWDGARRVAFLKWAADGTMDWRSDRANYTYLVHELRSTEAHALAQLKRQTSLEAAVISFDQLFERSGVKNIDSRLRYGRLAMLAFGEG